jgi:hypothetical protein
VSKEAEMAGDDPNRNKKKGKKSDPMSDFQRAAQQFQEVTKQAGEVLEQASAHARAQQAGQQGGGKLTGSISSLNVNFPSTSAPPPAFAGVCVVHKFPEYVLIDFGSIDPLQTEEAPGGVMNAVLQHVGRIALPDSAARQLFARLGEHYGGASGG